jgi:hypothetical protein
MTLWSGRRESNSVCPTPDQARWTITRHPVAERYTDFGGYESGHAGRDHARNAVYLAPITVDRLGFEPRNLLLARELLCQLELAAQGRRALTHR